MANHWKRLPHGQDAAEGGHSDNWSKGSGGATGGKPTPNMERIAEDKESAAPWTRCCRRRTF